MDFHRNVLANIEVASFKDKGWRSFSAKNGARRRQ
jgi:hypothetical protein